MHNFKPIYVAAAMLALLSGCLSVPADISKATGPDFAKARQATDFAWGTDAWPTEQWWQTYHDPQLGTLVAQALQDHPSLAVAQARVGAAMASLSAERADTGGRVDATLGANRQRYSSNGFFPAPLGGAYYNDFSAQLHATYDFDWWGRHRDLIAAALGETNARQAEAAQAAQVLAASVVQSYLRLQMLWARQDNANARVALQRAMLADRRARLARGLLASDALQNTMLDLAAQAEQVARFDTDIGREREALRALIGGDADALRDLVHVRIVPAMDAVPRELGMELLARRPDLQAARWRVEAQLGRVAAAEAAFRPDINLAASIGLDALSLGKLLRFPSRTPFVGGTLDLPLFDSGRLKAQLGIERTARDALLADYNEAVLNAVRDVAHEAVTLQGLSREEQAHAVTRQASIGLASNAEARQARGLADHAGVLTARAEILRQYDVELQLTDARLQTQVALVKALGGGYRAEPADTASAGDSTTHKTTDTHTP
jgi:multidrug efflux system outer membrane protein